MHRGTFFDSSRRIVEKFLNSVIAIDDQLSFKLPTETQIAEDPLDNFDADVDVSGLGVQEEHVVAEAPNTLHDLDYQDLSLAFAENGINCSAFRPDKERFETIDLAAQRIMESARNTDITILDWQMDAKFNQNGGSLAMASIKKILQHDKDQHGRLRLIVIYTAEPNPDEIANTIKAQLDADGDNAKLDKRDITFISEDLKFCQITVIEKKAQAIELREEVIKLFTNLTIGLLSNATLSAIGELRDKTHHILHTFNKHLDPAYLSHVVGLFSSPEVREKAHEVAFDYATDLISEEFKSNLQISHTIKDNLGLQRLNDWVEYINAGSENDFFNIKVGERPEVSIGSDRIKRLLSTESDTHLAETLRADPAIFSGSDIKVLENFKKGKIQINLRETPHRPHESLSAIECKRRDLLSLKPNTPSPTIKQGSIIQKDGNYYICMQPLCDSVRILDDTNFIFLRIEKIADEGKFTHVLRDAQGTFLKFNIKPVSKNIQNFKLQPDRETNSIKATEIDGQYSIKYTKDDEQEGALTWLGELKSNIAQAIANRLAEQISRVGLDTNEWLRLSSGH